MQAYRHSTIHILQARIALPIIAGLLYRHAHCVSSLLPSTLSIHTHSKHRRSQLMSTTERQVPSVPAPAKLPLPSDELWKGDVPDVDKLKDFFLLEGILHQADMLKIVALASAIFRSEPTLLYLNAPITSMYCVTKAYHSRLRVVGYMSSMCFCDASTKRQQQLSKQHSHKPPS
jgi:hypothetical protein